MIFRQEFKTGLFRVKFFESENKVELRIRNRLINTIWTVIVFPLITSMIVACFFVDPIWMALIMPGIVFILFFYFLETKENNHWRLIIDRQGVALHGSVWPRPTQTYLRDEIPWEDIELVVKDNAISFFKQTEGGKQKRIGSPIGIPTAPEIMHVIKQFAANDLEYLKELEGELTTKEKFKPTRQQRGELRKESLSATIAALCLSITITLIIIIPLLFIFPDHHNFITGGNVDGNTSMRFLGIIGGIGAVLSVVIYELLALYTNRHRRKLRKQMEMEFYREQLDIMIAKLNALGREQYNIFLAKEDEINKKSQELEVLYTRLYEDEDDDEEDELDDQIEILEDELEDMAEKLQEFRDGLSEYLKRLLDIRDMVGI